MEIFLKSFKVFYCSKKYKIPPLKGMKNRIFHLYPVQIKENIHKFHEWKKFPSIYIYIHSKASGNYG